MPRILHCEVTRILGLALLSTLFSTTIFAEDWQHFEKMANDTINAVEEGRPEDIDQLIHLQEQLMEIGIKACEHHALTNPQDAKMFQLIINNAENMKFLSLSEIKQQWHAKNFLMDQGIAVEKLHQNSTTGSLLDTVVRPATAYLALREYRRTGDAALLKQVRRELSEALLQLTYLQ